MPSLSPTLPSPAFDALNETQQRALCLIATSDRRPHKASVNALIARGMVIEVAGQGLSLSPGVETQWYEWLDTKYPETTGE